MKASAPQYFIIPALLFALAFFYIPLPCNASELPERFLVPRIKIHGADQLKKKVIRSALALSPPSAWRIWRRYPVGSEQDISDDAERITLLYQQYGFYHVVVSYDVHVISRKGNALPEARVIYTIEEGAPIVVDKLIISTDDNETTVDTAKVLDALPLKNGTRFEEKAYRESKKIILRKFGNNGYPFATITGKALIYPDTDSAVLSFSVSPGPRCFFGETTVADNARIINEKIIERSRTYRSGDLYDTSKVDNTQRNLYNLDVFKAALLEPGEPDEETGVVPLSLSLKSKKKRSIKLGAGYGEEDGIRLKAGYTYRNPLGWAGKLSFEAKRSDLLQKASTSYNQPFFLDSKGALQTEAGVLQEFLDSYESRQLFGNVKYSRDLTHHLDLTLAYLMEYNELRDLNLIDPEEIAAFRDDHAFFTSSVFTEIIRNTTDNDTSPDSGSILTGSMEIASTLTGSELTYVNPSIEAKKYVSLPFRSVLAIRLKMEAIADLENNEEIPVFKRLFLGGANTVRGYAYQKLGPLDASGNPEGGQSSMLANVELRRPLFGRFSGVLFLDGGMVSRDRFSYDNEQFRWSAGAGIRLGTPVGPIRFDVGYKLNPLDKTNMWRIHFNIGQTF